MVKVSVKWNNETYEDVEMLTDEPPNVFKTQMWTLCGVPPHRQKIMIPAKGLMKDDSDLSKMGIREGTKLMLVGTAEGSELKEPKGNVVFLEDLTDQEKAIILKEKKIQVVGGGLHNLGTTCYLNSVIQFLKPVTELKQIILSLPGAVESADPELALCAAFRQVFEKMEETIEPIQPIVLVDKLRLRFPQFARRSTSSMEFMQQDAEECLSCLLEVIRTHTTGTKRIEHIFEFEVQQSLKCDESEGEVIESSQERRLLLSCHLGTPLSPVDHLNEGIKRSLNEKIEKHCESLGRIANFTKTSHISSLPSNLIVHFVRFEWKGANTLTRSEATRAKILKKVQFSQRLDVSDFCSDDLKAQMKVGRKIVKQRMEEAAAARNAIIPKVSGTHTTGGSMESIHTGIPPMAVENSLTDLTAACSTSAAAAEMSEIETGFYDLVSIVTHQGRNADSGHYVGWIKHTEEEWLKLDDHKVSEVQWKLTDLTGGRGDYHIAILLMYKKCTIIPTTDELKASTEEELIGKDPKNGEDDNNVGTGTDTGKDTGKDMSADVDMSGGIDL